ncbi:MAG: hypothetical protein BYD32DRAFT_429927, partial [Podila humilis]
MELRLYRFRRGFPFRLFFLLLFLLCSPLPFHPPHLPSAVLSCPVLSVFVFVCVCAL